MACKWPDAKTKDYLLFLKKQRLTPDAKAKDLIFFFLKKLAYLNYLSLLIIIIAYQKTSEITRSEMGTLAFIEQKIFFQVDDDR